MKYTPRHQLCLSLATLSILLSGTISSLAQAYRTGPTLFTNIPTWKIPPRVAALRYQQGAAPPSISAPTNSAGRSQPKWILSEIGPHSRTWLANSDHTTSTSSAAGTASGPKQRMVEIASGISYWSGTNWDSSVPEFRPTDDGFVAARVQHAVRLSTDINQRGSVAVRIPQSQSGEVLYSTPIGIGILEPGSGRFGLIATITNSTGVQLETNCVLYPDALTGDGVCASLEFRVAAGSFSQNVIFTGRLDPARWGFSTNSRLQIISEFYSPPQPDVTRQPVYIERDSVVRSRSVIPDMTDEVLRFGELMLPTGHAVLTPEDPATAQAPALVAKEFRNLDSRWFLVESVAFRAVACSLQSLPDCSQNAGQARLIRSGNSKTAYAAIPSPPARALARSPAPIRSKQLAQNVSRPSGLLIDYVVTVGPGYTTPAVFQSDVTYVVAGPVYCGNVIMEAAVLKYPNSTGAGAVSAFIQITGTLTSKTSSYFPAICTAYDDDSIGQVVAHTGVAGPYGTVSSGVYYANPAIQLYYVSGSLSNMRFRYCKSGVNFYGTVYNSFTLTHSQFVKCLSGITLYGGSGSGSGSGPTSMAVTADNNLMSEVTYPLYAYAGPPYSATLRQCTIDGGATPSPYLVSASAASLSSLFVDCVLANIQALNTSGATASGGNNGFWNCPTFGSSVYTYTSANGPSPFQTGDLGKHYLTNNSGFQAKGNTGLSPSLMSDLKTRTTAAPLSLPTAMYVSGDLTLGPQVARYVNGAPDLGYYYPALDFTVGGMILDAANLTILPGTAIGLRYEYTGDEYGPYQTVSPPWWTLFAGFDLLEGSTLISQAKPENPSTFVAIPLVQETSPSQYWPYMNSLTAFKRNVRDPNSPDKPPTLSFRFCNFYLMQNDYHLWTGNGDIASFKMSWDSAIYWTLQDCALQGGHVNLGQPNQYAPHDGGGAVSWINNSLDRIQITLTPMYWIDQTTIGGNDMQLLAYNNLFRGGSIVLLPYPASQGNWAFRDNLFDKVVLVQDTTLKLDHDHNAYWPCTDSELSFYTGPLWGSQRRSTLVASAGTCDPTTDKTLLSAPSYQASTFGNYYLSSTSPTLVNVGSRSPAAAALYHFTTTPSQTKDATQANVNIGLHYVASANGKAQDYDNDGIPDFVENASGDGNYSAHVGVETDWQSAQTVAGTADASNTIYDDVDLDGDGIVGRLENLLGLNPLTRDNPLTLKQAGGTDSDYVFTFDTSASLDSSLWRPRLVVDDHESSGGWAIQALGSGHYQVSVMKHSFASGPHMLQLTLHEAMNQPNHASQSSLALTAPGPVVVWNNDSLFWTDPLANIFGSVLLVQAGLDTGVSDYVVRIYDENQNLLTSWNSVNDTGKIDQQLDLSTLNGGQGYNGDTAYVEIEAHPKSTASSSQREKRKNVRGLSYGNNTLEFAYGWDESPGSSSGRTRNTMYLNGVINILFDPSKNNRYNPTALPSDYSVPPFVMAYPGDQAYLKQDMLNPGIDNFFFSGHGSQETFGSTSKLNDQYAIFLSTEVAGMYNNLLDNNGSWALHGRSFRLVVLNTCYSARSDQWAIAFGISPSLTTLADFQRRGLPVQAFVGWTSGIDLPTGYFGDYGGYKEALKTFTTMWMQENTLDLCLWFAAGQSILQNMSFPMDSRYKIIGYEKMTRSGSQ